MILRAVALLGGVEYHGLRRACRLLAPCFPQGNSVIIEDGLRRLKIYLNDAYWVRHAFCGFNYEEEVADVLEKVLDEQSVFIDCGANNGYWSVYATEKVQARRHIVAVEPAESTFNRLSENLRLNGCSFSVLKKAVFSRSGVTLKFHCDPVRHDSNACTVGAPGRAEGRQVAWVESITVDDIFDSISSPGDGISNVVVKLDVEGMERAALQGARRLMDRGALFIYEDHGSDALCQSTQFVVNVLGLDAYFLRHGMSPAKIEKIDDLERLKTDSAKGYNLVTARRDSPALIRLLECSAPRGAGKSEPWAGQPGCLGKDRGTLRNSPIPPRHSPGQLF